jgi:hypothetical protein
MSEKLVSVVNCPSTEPTQATEKAAARAVEVRKPGFEHMIMENIFQMEI